MLDMGFGPEIKRLLDTPGMPPKEERQTLLFSATFPEDIQRMAQDILNNYLFITVGKVGGANSDITQRVLSVPQSEKREKLVNILNEAGWCLLAMFVNDLCHYYFPQNFTFSVTSQKGESSGC